jgi:uncharacterized protein YbaP (TraB family)
MTAARLLFVSVAGLLLACCTPEPEPADPAIWLVEGAGGQRAWLFGTIHGLERPARWKTPAVANALDRADVLMVEAAGIEDQAELRKTFAKLAKTPGQPALSERVAPEHKEALKSLLARTGFSERGFSDVETWAAALTLARAQIPQSKSEYGIDRAVMRETREKRLIELEGAEAQLGLFDALPEKEQRDLLDAVIDDADALEGESADLAAAWREGDMALIETETERGLLADPELREVLFTGRNRRWSERIVREMTVGSQPFVAVGAAHMAGPEGLPALLSDKGYTVTRIR